MRRHVLAVAAVLSAASALAVDQAAAGKVPGLHIHPWPPPGYGKPRAARRSELQPQAARAIPKEGHRLGAPALIAGLYRTDERADTVGPLGQHRNIGEKQ